MKKLWTIAWKDLTLTFRDPAALVMMLVTPFALTLAMAFAFGGGGGSISMSRVAVIVVNHDNGQFGPVVAQVLQSQDLADLLETTVLSNDAAARADIDNDKATAAVIIPAGFSAAMLAGGAPAVIDIYQNPTRSVGAGIVRSIVEQTLGRLSAATVSGQVAVSQLVANGLISPVQAATQGQQIGERAGHQVSNSNSLITLQSSTAEKSNGADFDWLTYMAPSMAIMFLMFTVSNGGRSILAERDWGTLSRLLTTPTNSTQVIGGKVVGIFLVGCAQMGILIAASGLMFGVKWGSTAGVVVLTLALVAAATGWGAVLAAYSRTAAQANQLGTMIALFFGMLAGNFVPRIAMPSWLRSISLFTPNAWGLEGFGSLTAGGGLSEIIVAAIVLLGMAVVLFTAATLAFRRQFA
jgi:ABC-2 type transport system permease protein